MTQLVVSEAEWTRTVIGLARLAGYRVAHFRASLSQSGRWHTAVQGDGVGFPDLVLAGDGRVLFVELKTDRGRLREEQKAWLDVLDGSWGIQAFVWRPRDVAEVKRVLGIKEV